MWIHQRMAVKPTPMTNEASAMPTVTSVDTPTTMMDCVLGAPGPGAVAATEASLVTASWRKTKRFQSAYTPIVMDFREGGGANKRTCARTWRNERRRQLADHPQRTAHQDLLRRGHRFLQERLENVPAGTVLRRIDALKHNKKVRLGTPAMERASTDHFEVALGSRFVVGAQAQFAVDEQLAHVSVVLADLETRGRQKGISVVLADGSTRSYVEAEAAVQVPRFRTDAHRQVGRTRVTNENQPRRPIRVGTVGHPALLRHDLDVGHWWRAIARETRRTIHSQRMNRDAPTAKLPSVSPPSIQVRTCSVSSKTTWTADGALFRSLATGALQSLLRWISMW